MIRRKNSKMMDLEFMLPKDMKEERIYLIQEDFSEEPREQFQAEAPFYEKRQAHSGLQETCCMCGKSSDESVLVPAFYCGRDQWICPKCLRSSEEPVDVGMSSMGNSSPLFEDPTSSDQSSSSMSMFD